MDDDEPTVKVRISSFPAVMQAGGLGPDPALAIREVEQLDRAWRNELATLLRENEQLRHRVAAYVAEIQQLRDTLHAIRGPR